MPVSRWPRMALREGSGNRATQVEKPSPLDRERLQRLSPGTPVGGPVRRGAPSQTGVIQEPMRQPRHRLAHRSESLSDDWRGSLRRGDVGAPAAPWVERRRSPAASRGLPIRKDRQAALLAFATSRRDTAPIRWPDGLRVIRFPADHFRKRIESRTAPERRRDPHRQAIIRILCDDPHRDPIGRPDRGSGHGAQPHRCDPGGSCGGRSGDPQGRSIPVPAAASRSSPVAARRAGGLDGTRPSMSFEGLRPRPRRRPRRTSRSSACRIRGCRRACAR